MTSAVSTPCLDTALDYLRGQHPRSVRGVEESRAINPIRFDSIAEMLLSWAVRLYGEAFIPRMVDSFVLFSTEVNLAQARYEIEGHYENKTFKECYDALYNAQEEMDTYLWGIYLTNIFWSHHHEISLFYEDRFLSRLAQAAEVVEIAPGHGAWGLWALHARPQASLIGYDISPQSLEIAGRLSQAIGMGERARYQVQDATDLNALAPGGADACICSFVVEHLEDPRALFHGIYHLLRPNGFAFVTGALTAAQIDHIYEFRRESEMVLMCEQAGLRVLETFSGSPMRTLPRARFLPRSMALIVRRPLTSIWSP